MKKIFSIVLIVVFSFANAFSFVGCTEAATNKEVRACWVSSVGNMDYPSDMGLSQKTLQDEIKTIVSNCVKNGLNTIFFQVRPMGDALYASKIFPWSVYLSGTQGVAPDNKFDPLAYFVKTAHAAGVELHAWINPYRIGAGQNVKQKLSADNPAMLHPEYTVENKSGLYYNPGLPESRQLILDGVAEIVRNYNVDGVHFDDYFYPYDMEGFDDSAAYSKYGNGLSLEDFRRHSVNQLVESVYTLVKTIDKDVEFGISPSGIWANDYIDPAGSKTRGLSSYADIFADSKKWVEEGWLDYICPQVYWSFENQAAPYATVVDWWDRLCTKNKMKLYIGIALYKVGTDEAGFEQGTIMEQQLAYAEQKESYAGHCFFRYGLMMENPLGALDSIRSYYNGETISVYRPVEEIFANCVKLQPATSLKITSPQNGAVISGSGVSVTGTAKAGAQVTVNGITAVVSSKGLFAAYVPLNKGSNTLLVQSGGESKALKVVCKSSTIELKELDINTAYPTGEVYHGAGETVCFEVDAPAGAAVTLTNGTVMVALNATEQEPTHYVGHWTVPAFPAGDKLRLGGFNYTVVLNGIPQTIPVELNLNLYPAGYTQEKVLQQDAYIFDASKDGSQMDHDPLSKGTRVTVTAIEGQRAMLENGYWVQQELLGDEVASPNDAANYRYEVVTVSAKDQFGYSTYSDGTDLQLTLSTGRRTKFELDSDQQDLQLKLEQSANQSVLRIVSRSGRKIAGYEIMPQKKQITLYIRFHEGELSGKTIMLDAGHGGADSGALSPGGTDYPAESELNLILTAALKEELEAAGATVLLTRTTDRAVSLAQRAEYSVEQAPDLFISLHHNSTDQVADFNGATGGLMLYSSPLSQTLAETLSTYLWNGVGQTTAECRRQSLYVCRQTRFPAVMVEAGYICNPLEYEILCQEDNVRRIAKNIIEGLNAYFVTVCS